MDVGDWIDDFAVYFENSDCWTRQITSLCFPRNKLFGYDFRGHTRGTLVVGIAYGYPYYKGSAIFLLIF